MVTSGGNNRNGQRFFCWYTKEPLDMDLKVKVKTIKRVNCNSESILAVRKFPLLIEKVIH